MPALRVMGFDGLIPRTSPTMLAITQARTATNVKLYSQEIKHWNGPVEVFSPSGIGPVSTIYKLYNNSGSYAWMTWVENVDIAPGPVADIIENRIYYTGQATPRKTNYAMATGAQPYPAAYYEMGVPGPTLAPTVASSSSVAPVETRAYVYTYTHLFGSVVEESAPSPASALVNLDTGATVTINGFAAPPSGHYNWQGINIYRTVAGATTDTYQFVAYIPLATTSYVDSLTVAQLGGVLPTIGWLPPPAGLLGITSISNGCLVGFVGNTLCYSQPFYPHAWPVAYQLSFPYPIVGIAGTESSVVVMTTKFPYIISGTTPGAMSSQQQPVAEPCISKASITSDQNGVMYASPNGMVSVGSAGAQLITDALFRRQEWQAINPGAIKGVTYDGKYIATFLPPFQNNLGLVMDPADVPMLSELTLGARAVYSDTVTGNLYIVGAADNLIYQVDADPLNPLTYTWTSKRFVNPQAVAMSAVKVDADYTQITTNTSYVATLPAILAANAAAFLLPTLGQLNNEQLNVLQVNGSLMQALPKFATLVGAQLLIYGDNQLICSLNLTSLDPIRLPAFKAREIYFTLTGNLTVRSVEMATSVRDLDPKAWSDAAQVPTLYT